MPVALPTGGALSVPPNLPKGYALGETLMTFPFRFALVLK
jgi:hypothetical protein